MSRLTREAWKAYFRGNFLRAGDLYKSAGEYKKAAKMYIKGGDLTAAAAAQETLGHVQESVNLLLRAGDVHAAAEVLSRHGHYGRAAQVMADMGNKIQAAFFALKGGNTMLAAQYFEQGGRTMEAARLLAQEGNEGKALLLFERTLKQIPSEEALSPSEQLQNRELRAEIARYFEQAGADDRAAEVYESLRMYLQAGQCWEASRNATKAMECYRRAGAMDRVAALAEAARDAPLEAQAEALLARGETEEAARLFAQADKKERAAALLESVGNLLSAAELHRELGDFEMAGNLFYRAQALLPAADCFRQARLFPMAKECFIAAGDAASGCLMAFDAGSWEEAVDLAPNDETRGILLRNLQALPESVRHTARRRLLEARLFLDLRQPSLALTCVENLPEGEGEDRLWLLYLKARALQEVGRESEAAEVYRRLLSHDLAFSDARERLASVSTRPGEGANVLAGRYVRGKRLGEGVFGVWYEGRDESLQVAVKILVLAEGSAAMGVAEKRDVLHRVIHLNHPGLLALRALAEDGGRLALVYEDFSGHSLADWMREGYAPSPYAVLDKLGKLLEALAEAHAHGLLHGHLSPDAVFMDQDGRLKVQGFGLVADTRPLAHRSSAPGLAPYLAPEAASGRALSPASDLYGAGALALRLISGPAPSAGPKLPAAKGERPFSAEYPLSPAVRTYLARLAAPDLLDRYATAEEALRDLAALEMPQGSVIAGRYEILEELGRGGMGQVFRVRDKDLEEVVALKMLRTRAGMDEASRARFLREIKLTRKITHPNVVRVFDLGTWRDTTFLTMEFIPGPTLSQWIREGEGRQATLRRKVEILKGIADGLSEAHRLGIIHRDLKPQNVILTPVGIPKLLDFGIASAGADETDLTAEGRFVGSPKYSSPEQIQGLPLDARSDIYCLGLLAYFLVTGQDAFAGDNPALIVLTQLKEQAVPPSKLVRLPASLEQIILSCLSKNPKDRPATLAAVTQALKEII